MEVLTNTAAAALEPLAGSALPLIAKFQPEDSSSPSALIAGKGQRTSRRGAPLPLPPCSPDFNPIENAFAKLKALLRKAAERTVAGLWRAIGCIADTFSQTECANYFAAAGYDPN